jgi:hypothetical protein
MQYGMDAAAQRQLLVETEARSLIFDLTELDDDDGDDVTSFCAEC